MITRFYLKWVKKSNNETNRKINKETMQEQFWQLTNQVMLSRALYVAADLAIADHLQEQPLPIETLAERSSSHPKSLKRLLRFLILNGVFTKDAQGLYTNNQLSLFIKKNHPQSIRPLLLHDDPTRWDAYGHLGYCIKTGKPSFDILYEKNYFDYVSNYPLLSQRFDEAMNIVSEQEDTVIAQKISFGGIVADIGGGQGKLLHKIKQYQPDVKEMILFDLPQVVEHIANLSSSIKPVKGSFFDPISIDADVFILKRILHDWDDDRALAILKNVAQTMKSTDKLYVIDAIVDRCADQKLITDIDLRLFAIFGGQEREFAEFENLFKQCGLTILSEKSITSIIHLIECKLMS